MKRRIGRIWSPRLAGLLSAASLAAPVAALMALYDSLSWLHLAIAVGVSVPFYFLGRNKVLLERYHPGWRGED
jgi:hypothetical protein